MGATGQKEKPGFRWDGQEYGKERKSQGPDRSGLNKHAEPLMGLLEVAGGCHPRHVAVRNTLELLDAKHDIRPAKCTAHWADAAAGKWTVMAKHAGDLAAKNKDTGMEYLDKLLTLVRKLTKHAEDKAASPKHRYLVIALYQPDMVQQLETMQNMVQQLKTMQNMEELSQMTLMLMWWASHATALHVRKNEQWLMLMLKMQGLSQAWLQKGQSLWIQAKVAINSFYKV